VVRELGRDAVVAGVWGVTLSKQGENRNCPGGKLELSRSRIRDRDDRDPLQYSNMPALGSRGNSDLSS
jgi:hypothetical protein